jgi:hypothetical protein
VELILLVCIEKSASDLLCWNMYQDILDKSRSFTWILLELVQGSH